MKQESGACVLTRLCAALYGHSLTKSRVFTVGAEVKAAIASTSVTPALIVCRQITTRNYREAVTHRAIKDAPLEHIRAVQQCKLRMNEASFASAASIVNTHAQPMKIAQVHN